MRPAVALLLALTAAWSNTANGGSAAQTSPHRFTAQWITAPGAPSHDAAVLHLRREITLETIPGHFIVHVSADNQFLLMVNGKLIGRGPAIGDVQHWRYETYDLAPALHPGRNLLAATVAIPSSPSPSN
jgi:hypothetical protein